MLDVFADTNSCLDGVKERCIAHGGNRLLMLCKNSPESIRSLHLKRNSNCGSSFFRADLSAGLVRGGGGGGGGGGAQPICSCRGRLKSAELNVVRDGDVVGHGARYTARALEGFGTTSLFSVATRERRKKTLTTYFFSSHQVALKLELHPDEVTTVPPPEPLFVSHSTKPKPRCEAD